MPLQTRFWPTLLGNGDKKHRKQETKSLRKHYPKATKQILTVYRYKDHLFELCSSAFVYQLKVYIKGKRMISITCTRFPTSNDVGVPFLLAKHIVLSIANRISISVISNVSHILRILLRYLDYDYSILLNMDKLGEPCKSAHTGKT